MTTTVFATLLAALICLAPAAAADEDPDVDFGLEPEPWATVSVEGICILVQPPNIDVRECDNLS